MRQNDIGNDIQASLSRSLSLSLYIYILYAHAYTCICIYIYICAHTHTLEDAISMLPWFLGSDAFLFQLSGTYCICLDARRDIASWLTKGWASYRG